MRRVMQIDGWYAANNSLERSFMRFYVKIDICNNGEYFYYPLRIFKDGKEALCFNLYSIADAVYFANNVVSNSVTIEEMIDKYRLMLFMNKFCLPRGIVKEDDNTILLSSEEVDNAIVEYYRCEDGPEVSIDKNVVYNNGDVQITYQLKQSYNESSDTQPLTNEDLKNVFDEFVKLYGLEVENFDFTYDIPDYGYEVKTIKPRYTGARLKVKRLENDKSKELAYPKNK